MMEGAVSFTGQNLPSTVLFLLTTANNHSPSLRRWASLHNPKSASRLKALNPITSAKSLLQYKFDYSSIPGIRMWTSLEGHYSTYYSEIEFALRSDTGGKTDWYTEGWVQFLLLVKSPKFILLCRYFPKSIVWHISTLRCIKKEDSVAK